MGRSVHWVLAGCLAWAGLAWGGEAPNQAGADPQDEPIPAAVREALERQAREIQGLKDQHAQEIERLQKQVELQQEQIEVLERMAQLLSDQVKKPEPGPATAETLPAQVATLEARAEQAARRDQELASAHDDLRDSVDAERRTGPTLPPPARENFLPTRTNESPVAIYGTLSQDFQMFKGRPSNFPSAVFSPHFYLLLNERILLETNPEFRATRTELESAQIDLFLTDNLTLVAGRFYSPLGFFNERLHTSWVFKTPDRPLMFSQVFPSPLSFNGVQLRGARYLGDLPVKLEYSGLVSNGFSLTAANPRPRTFADFGSLDEAVDDVNGDKAFGGRIGLSFPTIGLIAGLSGLANGAYDPAGQHDLDLWDVDLSWHRGPWDVRFEYANVHQQAPGPLIRRRGLYGQVAYRRYDSLHPVLQRLEGVFRYDLVRFGGIDLAATGLDFGARERTPIDRSRYTLGLNYYVYPSLIVKLAYEINDELRFRGLQDNGFLAQITWGW